METTAIDQGTSCSIEPRIAVIGVGGAGCNIVSDIYWADGSFDVIAINTDRNSLKETNADHKLHICKEILKGQGTMGNTTIGKNCGRMHSDEIKEIIQGYDVAFIIAGMGGGTGSGVAPVVAGIAQRLGTITFSILISPFSFETSRTKIARAGIQAMKAICRTTVVVENDLVLDGFPNETMEDAFRMVNSSISNFIAQQKARITGNLIDQLTKIEDVVQEDLSFSAENLLREAKTLD